MFPSSDKIVLNLFANIWLLVCCSLALTWEWGKCLTNEQHHHFPSQHSVEWQWQIFLYLLFSCVPSYHFMYNFSSVWICFELAMCIHILQCSNEKVQTWKCKKCEIQVNSASNRTMKTWLFVFFRNKACFFLPFL